MTQAIGGKNMETYLYKGYTIIIEKYPYGHESTIMKDTKYLTNSVYTKMTKLSSVIKHCERWIDKHNKKLSKSKSKFLK